MGRGTVRVRHEKEFDEITSRLCYCKSEGIIFMWSLLTLGIYDICFIRLWFLLSKHYFSIFLVLHSIFCLTWTNCRHWDQCMLMDDRFPSGKDFAVTAYYPCVFFQVPLHPFDKENLGLMRCSTFCLFPILLPIFI